MKIHTLLALTLLSVPVLSAQAQVNGMATTTTTTTTTGGTAGQAVSVAKDAVDASVRDRIVSVYGVGTPAAIQTWWVIFYDPAVPSHGRSVEVENGQVVKTYEAKGGVVYADTLTFPQSQVTGESAALAAAQDYAAKHALAYDHVRALLRMTDSQNFRWRVELLNGTTNKGFVFVNATDGAFALYAPAGAVPAKTTTSGTGEGIAGDVQHAGNEVKNTFLGIGGDLQQFFTGERTVDQ